MTVDEIVALARIVRDTPWARLPASEAPKLARAVLDLLSTSALPCGYDSPGIWPNREGPHVVIPRQWAGAVRCDEARALAVCLLRACDSAEDQK